MDFLSSASFSIGSLDFLSSAAVVGRASAYPVMFCELDMQLRQVMSCTAVMAFWPSALRTSDQDSLVMVDTGFSRARRNLLYSMGKIGNVDLVFEAFLGTSLLHGRRKRSWSGTNHGAQDVALHFDGHSHLTSTCHHHKILRIFYRIRIVRGVVYERWSLFS